MQGQITKVNAGFYYISSEGKEYTTRGSGNLRNQGESPLVGDFVIFEPNGFVTKILPRKNFLVRPKVANVDQAIIVTSLKEPKYSSLLLNKFLAIIEFNNIEPIILFTKKDLAETSYKQEYTNQGYKVFEIDNNNLETLNDLSKQFENKLSVFTGQTGAGKTTTINNLADLSRETQKISKALGRGKHTTRVVEIIDWLGGRLIDTPGFSSLEFKLKKLELAQSYKDFRRMSANCKFRSCLHNVEPECKVIQSVNDGKISKERYDDYLTLLKEANDE